MSTVLLVIYLLIGLIFFGACLRVAQEIDNETGRGVAYLLAILYILIWPAFIAYGFGKSWADKGLKNEKESEESTGKEI